MILRKDRPYNPYGLLQAEFSTLLTRNKSLGQQISINMMLSTLNTENPDDYGWNALGVVSGTVSSNVFSNIYLGNKYGNKLVKPIISEGMSEILGDPNRIINGIFELEKNIKIKREVDNDQK